MSLNFTGLSTGDKLERKYLAHFIDETLKGTTPKYIRLGKDLEEYAIDLNPDVEQTKNIIGENSVNVKGYEPQSSVEPYYCRVGEPLFEALYNIVKNRETGSTLETKVIDCLVDYVPATAQTSASITVVDAQIEDVVIVPQSIGGEDGVQIPFEIYYAGNRSTITGTISNGVFTPTTSSST